MLSLHHRKYPKVQCNFYKRIHFQRI